MDSLVSGQSWFFRYKIYHIPFWFCYHVMWWTITIGNFNDVVYNIFHSAYSPKFLFYVVFQALGAYVNLYILMPRYLYKGKYLVYLSLLIGTILFTSVCVASGYYFSAYVSELSFKELYGRDPSEYMHFFSINALPSTAGSTTLAMSIKLTKNWIASQKRQQALENEKLETELKFLKSQFNPHFLFNTINSIFVLIHKNPDLASESLATFSDLMRYQLYECNENEIGIKKELSFLDDFIRLEKLRIDQGHTRFSYEVDNKALPGQTIAPFILMPFVENAFKHVSKGKNQVNEIEISIRMDERGLDLRVRNTVSPEKGFSPELYENSGIGLKNVRRRLELLYDKKYRLDIRETERHYEVHLALDLVKIKSGKPAYA